MERARVNFTRWFPWIAVGLFAAALIARLYAAWCFRHNLNLDAGVVALMAKHIAEGKALPVFFYGQAHMGSLEALLSGLFCRVFGVSGFAVNLGTVLVSLGLLPVVYYWAKQAGGRVAGCAALAFIVIGPGGFFHYNASPRGAYAATLTLSALLLAYATRMVIQWRKHRRQSGYDFLALGVAAGLAWWSSQLTTAAILSAAVLLLVYMRQHVFTWRIAAGLLGFVFGSAPFWIYNALHDWPSFAFAGTFGRVDFSDGLTWFFTDRFASLMLPFEPVWARLLIACFYAVLVLWSFVSLILSIRAQNDARAVTLAGLLLFTLLFSAIYASSHFAAIATPRYFLPMVAPLAVLTGLFTRDLAQRFHPVPACAPLCFVIAFQIPVLPWAHAFARTQQDRWEQVQAIYEHAHERGLDTFYSVNARRAWTFATGERMRFVDGKNDFYLPHRQRIEWHKRPAVLEFYGDVPAFLDATQGEATPWVKHGLTVHESFVAPAPFGLEIEPSFWESATTSDGENVMASITDGHMHSAWLAKEQDRLTLTFNAPVTVAALRLAATHARAYPYRWKIEGRTSEGDWIVLKNEVTSTHWFWSGPRLYWAGPYHRVEARFDAHTLTALRLTILENRPGWKIAVHAVQLFEENKKELPNEEEALESLLTTLESRGITRLYADRWVANEVHQRTGGRIQTTLDPETFPNEFFLPPDPVAFEQGCAMLVRREDASLLRRVLNERALHFWETGIEPWVLFEPDPAHAQKETGMQWFGYGALLDHAQWALHVYHQARDRMDQGLNDTITDRLLDDALTHNPHLYAARKLRDDPAPLHPATIRFANKATFLGYEVSETSLHAGATFELTHVWQIPLGLNVDDYAVFVHFMRDHKILFQDDHVLLESIPRPLLEHQEDQPCFEITRRITIPEDTPAGPVQIVTGLVDRRYGHRLPVRTDLHERRRAVTLPHPLIIHP